MKGTPCDDPDHVGAIEIKERDFYLYEDHGRVEAVVQRSAQVADVTLFLTDVENAQRRATWHLRLLRNGAELVISEVSDRRAFTYHRCKSATS